MRTDKCQTLFSVLRRDRIPGLWLAFLLLLVPFVQPLAEANAAQKPFAAVICSTFGEAGKAAKPGLADDCAACIGGQHAPVIAVSALVGTSDELKFPDGLVDAALCLAFRMTLQSKDWRTRPPSQAPPLSV